MRRGCTKGPRAGPCTGSGRAAEALVLGVAPCASEFYSASRPAPPPPTTAHHTGPASTALCRIDSEITHSGGLLLYSQLFF